MAVITSYQSEVPSLAKSVVTRHDCIIGTHRLAARLIWFQKIIRLVNTSHLMIQSFQIKHVRRRNYISIFCGLWFWRIHSRLFGSFPAAVYSFMIII